MRLFAQAIKYFVRAIFVFAAVLMPSLFNCPHLRGVPVETIAASVAMTGRLLVVDEAFSMCGMGAEIAASIMEHAFDEMDAPVGRLHTGAVAQPFSPSLEDAVVVSTEKIVAAAGSVQPRSRGFLLL